MRGFIKNKQKDLNNLSLFVKINPMKTKEAKSHSFSEVEDTGATRIPASFVSQNLVILSVVLIRRKAN